MRCTFCKKVLERGPHRRYETLADHVFNPNLRVHPLRPTFVCNCSQADGRFWNEHGHVYGGRNPRSAIGSAAHRFDVTQAIANKIHPLCSRTQYPYDSSYRIANLLARLIWPILVLLRR